MATPISARRSAGASLTPSPVMATTWPFARSASEMRSLDSGELRAKTASAPESSSASRSGSLMASSSVPVTTRIPPGPVPIPTWRAIAAAVSPLSPVTTCTRIPARRTRAIVAGTSARGGSCIAVTPSRHRSCSASSREAGTGTSAHRGLMADVSCHDPDSTALPSGGLGQTARGAGPWGRSGTCAKTATRGPWLVGEHNLSVRVVPAASQAAASGRSRRRDHTPSPTLVTALAIRPTLARCSRTASTRSSRPVSS
jgi:hypothetical protein